MRTTPKIAPRPSARPATLRGARAFVTHRLCAPLCLLAGALGSSAAWSAPTAAGVALQGLAATCANCHGTQGKAVDKSEVPGLAGLPAGYFIEQMNAFKSGARTATVMHQIAKGYSPAQIEALATYFASQPR